MLVIVTAKHQWEWDAYAPLVLMAYRSPALLMLGTGICTPAEMVVRRLPDVCLESPGLEYARKLQDCLDSPHEFTRNRLCSS